MRPVKPEGAAASIRVDAIEATPAVFAGLGGALQHFLLTAIPLVSWGAVAGVHPGTVDTTTPVHARIGDGETLVHVDLAERPRKPGWTGASVPVWDGVAPTSVAAGR